MSSILTNLTRSLSVNQGNAKNSNCYANRRIDDDKEGRQEHIRKSRPNTLETGDAFKY